MCWVMPPGLARDDVGAADGVEQRSLAVVDVAHDGHDRRTRLERLRRIDVGGSVDVDVAVADALDVVAELGDQKLGRILVDRLGQRDRHAHLEQRLHQVGAALGHAVGQLLHRDRLWDDNIADLLLCRAGLHVVPFFLLAGAAQRGKRAGTAVVLTGQSAGDGQLARVAAIFTAARRSRGFRSLGCRGMAGTAEGAFLRRLGLRRGGLSFVGRRRGGSERLLLRAAGGFLRGRLLGLAVFLGAAALFLIGGGLGLFLAAAGVLERGHAGFLGLAQQLLLKLPATRDLIRRRGLARLRSGGRWFRRRLGCFGDRLGSRRRRSFARAAQDAALLDLDHHGVRTAVAEALLDLAGLDRALEAQRRPGAKLRFVGLVCHSIPSSNLQSSRSRRRERRPLALRRGQ